MEQTIPDQLRPPTDAERGILQFWLEQSKRAADQLEALHSPWFRAIDSTAALLYDVLHPEEA